MDDQGTVSEIKAYLNMQRRIPGQGEPVFEDPVMQQKVWGNNWGTNNDVGQLRKVLVHRPGKEWDVMLSEGEYVPEVDAILGPDNMWYWRGRERPDIAKIQAQHDHLTSTLKAEGAEVIEVVDPLPHLTKTIYTRDTAMIVKGGAVLCRFGIDYRRGEELPVMRTFAKIGMPILHTIHGAGLMEGGSFLWLNENTAAVSIGHRSNHEGARQLEEVLNTQGVELLWVDNTGYGLHIDGSLVMLKPDLAIAFVMDLPWWFLMRLKELGIHLLDADEQDGWQSVNCLAVSPGRVIMPAHAERSAEKLIKAGIEVIPVEYDESPKGGGGIHCSTLPLIRDDV
jgi:N-dimethylarginine dimethylaminohydrolase